jgi:hypothetical protein
MTEDTHFLKKLGKIEKMEWKGTEIPADVRKTVVKAAEKQTALRFSGMQLVADFDEQQRKLLRLDQIATDSGGQLNWITKVIHRKDKDDEVVTELPWNKDVFVLRLLKLRHDDAAAFGNIESARK